MTYPCRYGRHKTAALREVLLQKGHAMKVIANTSFKKLS